MKRGKTAGDGKKTDRGHSATREITVKGAREHNLRNIDLSLPRGKLICFAGVSGSGKSSLAFDTLYAEGQRRYVESLSNSARQFMGQMPKPDVDLVTGLSPSISISQKSSGNNPRSTVGTITEIYDFLRVLFARVGTGYCPNCHIPIQAQTGDAIVSRVLGLVEQYDPSGIEAGPETEGDLESDAAHPTGATNDTASLWILAPLVRGQKGEFKDLFEDLRKQGFNRARVDGETIRLADSPPLDRTKRHDVEVVIDRIVMPTQIDASIDRARLNEAVELALRLGESTLIATVNETDAESIPLPKSDRLFSSKYACGQCGTSFRPPTPQLFSFNSPQGMCTSCDGIGRLYTFVPELLIPDPTLSVRKGAVTLLGKWGDIGRYRSHTYRGVADAIDTELELEPGTMLSSAWEDLPEKGRHIWLWGVDESLKLSRRVSKKAQKHVDSFDGLIPELLDRYRTSRNKMQLKQFEKYMNTMDCPDCHGRRLNNQASAVRITSTQSIPADANETDSSETDSSETDTDAANPNAGTPLPANTKTLPELCDLSIDQLADFFTGIDLAPTDARIASEVLKEIQGRIGFLLGVGLEYLTLGRTAPTLSGGESQRIRLAGQIGSGLSGVLYILDEPSIGLHPRDNDRLIATLTRLRDAGNTLIVVEHDEDTMRAADLIVDFGPGPGVKGGHVVASGTLKQITDSQDSVTGAYLSGRREIKPPDELRKVDPDKQIVITGARFHNLKNVTASIPLGVVVCVTGVSGSGKSSLIGGILEPALRRDLNGAESVPGDHDSITGIEHLDKTIAIDQSPIGRTPRSNPATYVKVFDEIRSLFAKLPDAKTRGYTVGRFSFNVDGGRCSACDGNGATKLEMDFLADIWVKCPVCQGERYNRETLSVKFKGKSIADVLDMDISEALELFQNIPRIAEKLQTLVDVGLEYLKLGQPSPTLSGGEAQRIKLSRELSRRDTGSTLYVLDEPTTGLHFADIDLLLGVINRLADRGNSIVIVEHNLDVIKTADWVIDMGVEGGAGGGEVIATGQPTKVAKAANSYTGEALAGVMGVRRTKKKIAAKAIREVKTMPPKARTHVVVEGAQEHNLRHVDVSVPRDAMTVFCGPSGSGKSSMAMDTIYAEGQRRYVESLSSYARQFIGQVQKPKAERIEGLSPAVALEQKNLGHSPRSTVGTVTEVYDYLRILYAKLGTMHCPDCDIPIGTQTPDQIIDKILDMPTGTKALVLAPIEVQAGEASKDTWASLRASGYARVRIDGETVALEDAKPLDPRRVQPVQVVVDRISIKPEEKSRISDSVEQALSLGIGVIQIAISDSQVDEPNWEAIQHSQHLVCTCCGRSFNPLTPHHFSFNSAIGWCTGCDGLGTQTGTNPASLMGTPQQSLLEGASLLWPSLDHAVSRWMMRALARSTGIPIDQPIERLTLSQKRILFHGLGPRWIEVRRSDSADEASNEATDEASDNAKKKSAKQKKESPEGHPNDILFRYQFKGFYPALEEASRLTPGLRAKLESFVAEIDCSVCNGSRLREESAAVRFREHTIGDLVHMPLDRLAGKIEAWDLDKRELKIARELIREVQSRVSFLRDVGLDYLTMHRGAATLSGGEAQRIRLASQLGSGLCGVLYVLDEPTIGLHPRDNLRLLSALHRLRDQGNTLLVVEHDHDVIAGSDYLCDFGPKAGRHGGNIVAQGPPNNIQPIETSVTAPYLSSIKQIELPASRRPVYSESGKPMVDFLQIRGARENNLRDVDIDVPLGVMTAVTGPSGSGKSSLVNDIIYPSLARRLHRAKIKPGRHDEMLGLRYINKVIRVDQSPLGNSPSSNPATYTGVFDLIRSEFAELPEARERRFSPRTFSFNVSGGRCETCEGSGQRKIEMHFLPDVWIPCEECGARRYNEDVLEVKLHGRSIADVLEMPCGEAVEVFADSPRILRVVQTLCDVGLDYITLGQSAPTLSGGEAQRVKLAAELARPATGHTLYLLDEPTTGLHFGDIEKLLFVMQRLVEIGNTVVVIEHNLDVIKCADWVIDIGPGAGVHGGHVVFEGPPEGLAATAKGDTSVHGQHGDVISATASFLADSLAGTRRAKPTPTPSPTPTYQAANIANAEPARTPHPAAQPEAYSADRAKPTPASTSTLEQPAAPAPPLRPRKPPAPSPVLQPWRALGRRWHTLPKGFPKDAAPLWPLKLAERTLDLLSSVAGEHALAYTSPDRVSVKLESGEAADELPLWAELETKQLEYVRLKLTGPRSAIDVDQLLSLDFLQDQSDTGTVDLSNGELVTVTFHLKRLDDARSQPLRSFLTTHLERTRLSS
ncbi:excinuclease ABC subunit A [Neorhodopirellula lusitana]|uniref:UvrABC system protein A n=1 Tax=Neorhodopirellula lusitana TaxID=445327 RepID=A0ABY1PNN6_9BACT|nr:excinuclease ABC subunit UvrA [Neorhodopirellula lusitana]SMP39781.1 excinuclease ABC subunit A [Neorhodopirellula lusitana]